MSREVVICEQSESELDILRCLTELDDWDFWSYESILKALSENRTMLLYVKDSEGWSGLSFSSLDVDTSDLLYVYVKPQSRRQGLAYELLTSTILKLKEKGYRSFLLEVRPTNTSAIKLYEKLFMQNIARRKKYYSDGEDALIFSRDL